RLDVQIPLGRLVNQVVDEIRGKRLALLGEVLVHDIEGDVNSRVAGIVLVLSHIFKDADDGELHSIQEDGLPENIQGEIGEQTAAHLETDDGNLSFLLIVRYVQPAPGLYGKIADLGKGWGGANDLSIAILKSAQCPYIAAHKHRRDLLHHLGFILHVEVIAIGNKVRTHAGGAAGGGRHAASEAEH